MRKIKTLLLTALTSVVLCLCFLFAGCGSAAGTYSFDSLEVEMLGEKVVYEAGDSFMGMEISEDEYPGFTLNKDGTIEGMDDCTWEEEDGKVVIKDADGETEGSFEKDGSKLIIEESFGGMTMTIIYKK